MHEGGAGVEVCTEGPELVNRYCQFDKSAQDVDTVLSEP